MSRKKKLKISAGDVLRIFAGIFLSYFCITGILNAILYHTGEPASIVIAILTIIICILFLLIGIIMMFSWLPVRKKRKPSAAKQAKKA